MHQLLKNCIVVASALILSNPLTATIIPRSAAYAFADEARDKKRADDEAIAIFRAMLLPENAQSSSTSIHCSINNEWTHWAIPGELVKKHLGVHVNGDLVSPHGATWPETLLGQIFSDNICPFGKTKLPSNDEPPMSEESQRIRYENLDLSYPIFNNSYNRALVVLSRYYVTVYWTGSAWNRLTAGGGDVLVFEKQKGRWNKIGSEELWVE